MTLYSLRDYSPHLDEPSTCWFAPNCNIVGRVVIFGNVNTFFEDLPITIQIYHETNLVSVDQVPVAKDGTFVSSFYATGSKWSDDGTYMIRVQYTTTQIAETTFEFFSQAIDK